MIGVIGIIAVLMTGIIKTIGSVTSRYKLTVVVDQVRTLQKNVSSYYSAKDNYVDLGTTTTKELIEEKVVPADMAVGEKIYNSFKGEVTLGAANSNLHFQITFKGLTQSACIELGMMNWQFDSSSDLISIDINGTKYVWPLGNKAPDAADALPVNMAKVGVSCKNDSENILTWVFQ